MLELFYLGKSKVYYRLVSYNNIYTNKFLRSKGIIDFLYFFLLLDRNTHGDYSLIWLFLKCLMIVGIPQNYQLRRGKCDTLLC